MRRKFPEHYPYFNRHGLVFTEETLNLISKYFLTKKKPLSLELGLEISYILMWCMEKATDELHFIKLMSFFFRKLIRTGRKKSKEVHSELLEQILDPESQNREDKLLQKLDVKRVIGGEKGIQDLLKMRARDRLKEIERLKKQWEG